MTDKKSFNCQTPGNAVYGLGLIGSLFYFYPFCAFALLNSFQEKSITKFLKVKRIFKTSDCVLYFYHLAI